MIIRSQDKRKIIPLNQPIYIETVADEWKISTERFFLGSYSTEEKAIKVLDMICDACRNTAFIDEQAVMFYMPQDCEV